MSLCCSITNCFENINCFCLIRIKIFDYFIKFLFRIGGLYYNAQFFGANLLNIINTIRELPTRYWLNDTKEWEVPFKKLEDLVNTFADKHEIQIVTDYPECFAEKEDVQIPNGFEFKTKPFNHQIEGFQYGLNHDKWLLGDEQGLGKALALDTKVYTLNGYKLMRDIQVGDYVFGKDGKSTKVTAVYNHSNVEMYRITFSDGVSIKCCKDHLWQIHDQHGIKVVDTQWFTKKDQFGRIRKDNLFSDGSGSYKYWIDRCEPIQFDYQEIPIDPYVLGAILGDGGLTSSSIFFTTVDDEIFNNINSRLPKGYELYSTPSMNDIEYIIKGTKGKTNDIFIKWASKYKIYDIESNYINYHNNTINNLSKEVVVVNY